MTFQIKQRPIYQKGQKPAKSTKIRSAAQNAECTLKIPGVCNHDPSTVVGAHLRILSLAGMGQKPDDLFIVDACGACHSAQEDRSRWSEVGLGWEDLFRALIETQRRRRAAGLIWLEGEQP